MRSTRTMCWTSWPRSPLLSPARRAVCRSRLADKLRALEMLYKHLGLGDGAKTEGVVIVDSES